jgi:hypothetical protein
MLKFCIWSQKFTVEQNMAIYGNDPQSAMLPKHDSGCKRAPAEQYLNQKANDYFRLFLGWPFVHFLRDVPVDSGDIRTVCQQDLSAAFVI